MTCAVDDAMGDAMGDAFWACLVITLNCLIAYIITTCML